MPKNRKRRPTKRHKRRALRDARGRRWTRDQELVACFAKDVELTPTERRLAAAAVPKMSRFHTSHWLAGGIDRARQQTGCGVLTAIDVLERMQRWAHREEWIAQHDAALQLCGLELLRRRHGAPARTIQLPEPLRPFEVPVKDLLALVAQWEAQSYCLAHAKPTDSEMDLQILVGASLQWVGHLADTDGVPVRLDRLDPSAFAVELMDTPEDLGPPPEGWVPMMLSWVAEIYDRLVARGNMAPDAAAPIITQLQSLAMATAGSGSSHAA